MRHSRILSYLMAFFLIPSLILYPQLEVSAIAIQPQNTSALIDASQIQIPYNYPLTCDDIFDLLEEIEDGEFEKRCSIEDLHLINHYLAFFLMNGLLSNDPDEKALLEKDIYELLNQENDPYQDMFSLNRADEFSIISAISYSNAEILLCKNNWVKKTCHQVKKCIKHHKKAIIIGVVAVAAVTIVICTLGATSTAGAAAAGAVASSESEKKEKDEPKKTDKGNLPPPSQSDAPSEVPLPDFSVFADIPESPNLKIALDEHTASFKELATEHSSSNEDFLFREKAKNFAASIAHGALDGISELAAVIPQLNEEIKAIGSRIIPEWASHPNNNFQFTPKENYAALKASCHQRIDQLFDTNQAESYSPEAKEGKHKFVTGIIPPPALLTEILSMAGCEGRIAITQASAVRGWAVGQPTNNRTLFGTVPKWSTVRRRHWKNQAEWAKSNSHDYTPEQLQRMQNGLAPQRIDPRTGLAESMELHHNPAQRDGGLFDVTECWPDEHAELDKFRRIGE